MLRYLDVPRRDPTAETAMLRILRGQREVPRIPTLRRTAKADRLQATVAECLAAKMRARRRGC